MMTKLGDSATLKIQIQWEFVFQITQYCIFFSVDVYDSAFYGSHANTPKDQTYNKMYIFTIILQII